MNTGNASGSTQKNASIFGSGVGKTNQIGTATAAGTRVGQQSMFSGIRDIAPTGNLVMPSEFIRL